MKQALLFISIFFLLKAEAQVVVASGTSGIIDAQMAFEFQSSGDVILDPTGNVNNGPFVFTNAAFTFLGNVNPTITVVGSQPSFTLASLTMNSTGNYTLSRGSIEITNKLDLQSGVLSVKGTTTKLIYSGKENLDGRSTSYIDGKLFMKGSGARTFPIGFGTPSAGGAYLPVTLENVKLDDALTEIGFEAIAGPSGISSSSTDIKEIFTGHYWALSNGNNETYSGSQIKLSLNGANTFLQDGDPIILEVDSNGTLNNLFGTSFFTDVESSKPGSAKGVKYALAKSNAVTVRIHRVITPNGDGDNDYLYIEGIDFYATNTVKLVDRWGVIHFTKENFKNYTTQNPADFDFSKLSTGNYICVVELGSGVKVAPKMISVIK